MSSNSLRNLSRLTEERTPPTPEVPSAEVPPAPPESEPEPPQPPEETDTESQPANPEAEAQTQALREQVQALTAELESQRAQTELLERLAREQAGFLKRLQKILEGAPEAGMAPPELPDICRELQPQDLAAVYTLQVLGPQGEVFRVKGHHILTDAISPAMLPEMPRIFESNLYTLVFKTAMAKFYTHLQQFAPPTKGPLPSSAVSFETVKDVQPRFSTKAGPGFVGDSGT